MNHGTHCFCVSSAHRICYSRYSQRRDTDDTSLGSPRAPSDFGAGPALVVKFRFKIQRVSFSYLARIGEA